MVGKPAGKNTMEILSRLQNLKQKQRAVNPEIREWCERQPSFERAAVLERLEGCGSALLLREWLEHEGQITLAKANFCKSHLLCRCCAARRAGKTVAKHSQAVRHVLDLHPNLIPVLITLTVKNGQNLDERFRHIANGWRLMTQHANHAKDPSDFRAPIEWNKVQGFVRAAEITNKGNGWHPHYHVLCLVSDWVDPYRLAAEWLEFTGDSSIVDVRKVYSKEKDENDIRAEIDPLEQACFEAFKYSTKFGDLTGQQIAEVWHTLSGRRFISSGGLLRGLKLEEELTDADLTGRYREFWALWMKKTLTYSVKPAGWVPLNDAYTHKGS
jgi:hypothetical protein